MTGTRTLRSYLLLLAAFLSVLLAAGCGDDDSGVQPVADELMRDTPTHLLDYYAYAVEHEDIEMYEGALHDAFLHVFPLTVLDSLGLPPEEPWWGKTAEVAAMRDLFSDSTVTKIEFEFAEVDPWVAVTDSVGGEEYNGVFSRTSPVTALTVEEAGEEPKVLILNKSYFDITVIRDPSSPQTELFVILKIEEVLKVEG
jgi:hypothetical protein